MHIGMTKIIEKTVEFRDAAASLGSGALEVFSTPSMILMMEACSVMLINPELSEEQTTVGTVVNIRHLAPAPIGAKVVCESELVGIDRARLEFTVRVLWGGVVIGEGMHERFVVNKTKFMQKLSEAGAGL